MRSTPRRSGADLAGSAPSKTSHSVFFVALVSALLVPREAQAMHLADGVLPARWCAVWTLFALPFVLYAWRRFDARRLRDERLFPLVAMVGAAVFAISCMPVPIPIVGSSSHPCGTGLAAIVVGPLLTVLITTIALVLQALFLAHGGVTTLGADIVSMGIVGGFVGFAVYRVARRWGLGIVGAAFLAGLLSDWATYATTALELALGLHGERSLGAVFGAVCLAFAPTQLPLGLLEGGVTAGALAFLARRRAALFARIDHVAEERA
jgi:cobalt/nickel transport system permease protein